MQKLKRILALIGAIFLLGMYIAVLILGLTARPETQGMLMAAIGCTIAIPCILYGVLLVARVLSNKNETEQPNETPSTTKASHSKPHNKRKK